MAAVRGLCEKDSLQDFSGMRRLADYLAGFGRGGLTQGACSLLVGIGNGSIAGQSKGEK
jgi:hypothetical protein